MLNALMIDIMMIHFLCLCIYDSHATENIFKYFGYVNNVATLEIAFFCTKKKKYFADYMNGI